MSEPFGPGYAGAYDDLYRDKDYAAECERIREVFRACRSREVRSVLDLGCGTGGHLVHLARMGYDVAGVDRSADMLARAQEKSRDLPPGARPELRAGDIRTVDLDRRFDAVLMMFAVLGYQLENADVLAALATARRHLAPGGLLVFDVWYGPAVLRERPSARFKVVPTGRGTILRAASAELDTRRHVCTVHYELWELEDRRLVAETRESHGMRYFFPRELELYLSCAGFSLSSLEAFPGPGREPDETTWNVLCVGEAGPPP